MIKSESDYVAFKTDYLNQYFKNLNLSSKEPDWNVLILQAMSFKEFQDCKALLDMLEDDGYVSKYKYSLENKFDDMVDWFLKEKLEITSRPLRVYASDNRNLSLLVLYMVIKREGGQRRVTENNMWAMVAKDMGFDYHDGEFMRLIYAMYLDVLVYYYKFKSTQQMVAEREIVKDVADVKPSKSLDNQEGTSRHTGAEQDGVDGEHYAFYAGNDWYGINKLQKRTKFDFRQAERLLMKQTKASGCTLGRTIMFRGVY
ncbi:putative transcription factor & chromatin remodeling ARID family [Helianthus annuus]|nr:putative transcription factor & chromatin remodeling ARID family [Helianthus annuus]